MVSPVAETRPARAQSREEYDDAMSIDPRGGRELSGVGSGSNGRMMSTASTLTLASRAPAVDVGADVDDLLSSVMSEVCKKRSFMVVLYSDNQCTLADGSATASVHGRDADRGPRCPEQ